MNPGAAGGCSIDAEPDVEAVFVTQRFGDRVDVGQPSHFLLQRRIGVGDHFGVEPQARHHQKHELLLGAARTLDKDHAEINFAVDSGECCTDRLGKIVEGQLEVAGEQVTGARRQEGYWDAGSAQRLGDRSHGAVTAGGHHDVGTRIDRFFRDLLARILLRRFEPEAGSPPSRLLGGCDRCAQRVEVHLDRVVDDCGDPLRMRGFLESGCDLVGGQLSGRGRVVGRYFLGVGCGRVDRAARIDGFVRIGGASRKVMGRRKVFERRLPVGDGG